MHPIRLAIDVMGGDYGPSVILKGVLEAKRRCGSRFAPCLCGDRDRIRNELKALEKTDGSLDGDYTLEHCPDSISTEDIPRVWKTRIWKDQSDSSIIRCITLQKEKAVDASVSAGDTGVLMGAAIFILGRSTHSLRPGLGAFLPTTRSRPSLLLDVGANLKCRASHLSGFGILGSQYYRTYFSVPDPSIGLLSIGREPRKGTKTLREAAEKLSGLCSGFIGFVEGSEVLEGRADVIVCEGFVGNVLLKACESFHTLIQSVLDRRTAEAAHDQLAVLNPDNYGAVPLLGIDGMVFKAHGAASSTAITNAVLTAITAVEKSACGEERARPTERHKRQ